MAIKDSIVNLKKGLRTTLTNVPALIDTLVRGLDGVAEAAEEEKTYSTDERIVGTWIDGSEIYERTYNCGKLPNASQITKATDVTNINQIIEIKGIAIASTTSLPIPYAELSTAETKNTITISSTKTTITIKTEANLSPYTAYVTLRYTKAEANRTPENDTKNGSKENEEIKNER